MSSPVATPVSVVGKGIMASCLLDTIQREPRLQITTTSNAKLVFDASTVDGHVQLRRQLSGSGKRLVALVPTADLISISPMVNPDAVRGRLAVGLVSSAVQVAAPLVHSISLSNRVDYVEAGITIASCTLGMGGRTGISELTKQTGRAVACFAGARRGKGWVMIASGTPPTPMRAVVHCLTQEPADPVVLEAALVEQVQIFRLSIPGCRLQTLDVAGRRISLSLEVAAADAQARHEGNLEIMSIAALQVAALME